MQMIKDQNKINKLVTNNFDISKFLSEIIKTHFGGVAFRFAQSIGIKKNMLSEWINSKHSPSLPRIIDIAQACNCSVKDILLGDFRKVIFVKSIAKQKAKYRPIIKGKSKQNISNKEFKKKLIATINNNPTLSLQQIAIKLNTDSRTIKKYYKSIANQVIGRHKKYKYNLGEKSYSEFKKKVFIAAKAIAERGEKPTNRKIYKELNGDINFFRKKHRIMVKKIIKKFR
jgi:transcriptional regulator with XRE-family HTH domain